MLKNCVCGTVCQRQCSLLSHCPFFQRRLKTELFERSYNWHRTSQTTLLLRTHFHFPADFLRWPQPWSLLTIMLLWHSFLILIIIILLLLFLCVPNFNGCRNQYWVCVSTMTGTVCFERKNICNAEFGDLGPICHQKCHIWNRQPWFAYSLCHFYVARMTIKGRLLLSAAIIKHF